MRVWLCEYCHGAVSGVDETIVDERQAANTERGLTDWYNHGVEPTPDHDAESGEGCEAQSRRQCDCCGRDYAGPRFRYTAGAPSVRLSNDDLASLLEAGGPYNAWTFTYEYPGLFCYSHKGLPFRVFCTPDWSDLGMVDIQVQDAEGAVYEKYSRDAAFLGERSATSFLSVMKPTLDRLLAGTLTVHLDVDGFTADQIDALLNEVEAQCEESDDHPGATYVVVRHVKE